MPKSDDFELEAGEMELCRLQGERRRCKSEAI